MQVSREMMTAFILQLIMPQSQIKSFNEQKKVEW